jgi:hypothetical protein
MTLIPLLLVVEVEVEVEVDSIACDDKFHKHMPTHARVRTRHTINDTSIHLWMVSYRVLSFRKMTASVLTASRNCENETMLFFLQVLNFFFAKKKTFSCQNVLLLRG